MRRQMKPKEALDYLQRFFEGIEESVIWHDYIEAMMELDGDSERKVIAKYDLAWDTLRITVSKGWQAKP